MRDEALIDWRPSGLMVPETSIHGRLIGVVVDAGRDVRDVQPGDVLELSRWGGDWWRRPGVTLGGTYGPQRTLIYHGPSGFELEALGRDQVASIEPWRALYRIGRIGQPEAAGIDPIADRVLIRRVALPDSTASGLALAHLARHRWAYGQVIERGSDVRELAIGDWVISEADTGSYFRIGDDEEYAIVQERRCLARWPAGSKPGHVESVIPCKEPEA